LPKLINAPSTSSISSSKHHNHVPDQEWTTVKANSQLKQWCDYQAEKDRADKEAYEAEEQRDAKEKEPDVPGSREYHFQVQHT
jgi:hypothetical protein